MSEAWKNKNFDLQGQGLQSANAQLVTLLKKRSTAYGLLLLFPSGMHRAYLNNKWGAWAYRLTTLLLVAMYFFHFKFVAALLLIGLIAFALYDIRWLDDQIVKFNKALRIQVYMRQSSGAPKGYAGRYNDDTLDDYVKVKEQERAGHIPIETVHQAKTIKRAPSFAEQEGMLRELAKSREKKR